jgi:Co/Zn/Cd efflux system component
VPGLSGFSRSLLCFHGSKTHTAKSLFCWTSRGCGNYGLSLIALSMALVWRSRTALVKGLSMGAYGLYVIGQVIWNLSSGVVPEAGVMGAIGFMALVANASVAVLLYSFRDGDANMRSVWPCSRYDAIGNIAVILAASGVFGLDQGWPDIVVAIGMAGSGFSAAVSVVRQARAELKANSMSLGGAVGLQTRRVG